MCDICGFVSVVCVILMVGAFLADSRTGFMVLLDIVQEPLVIVASYGLGHMLVLKASTITRWSERLTGIFVVSPGISILLSFMWIRGGLGVLCVLYCGVLCLVCIVLLPIVLCTVLWFTLMCGVLCCVITGECCGSLQVNAVQAGRGRHL